MPDVPDLAELLQVWAYPLVFAQRMRLNFTQPLDPDGPRPATSAGARAGRLGHQRRLAGPDLAVGVAPNVDTLYSVAWLDLGGGEREVVLPDPGDRYLSLQVGCADTTSPLVISRRTHGDRLPPVRVGRGVPTVTSEGDRIRVSTPARWAMVVARTGVVPGDPADLAAAHAVQDGIRLVPARAGEPAEPPPRPVDVALTHIARQEEILQPREFAIALTAVLDDHAAVVPAGVAAAIRACDLAGLATGSAERARTRGVADGLRQGYDAIRSRVGDLGRTVNGWSVNDRGAQFGDDHLLRAAVAHAQIYVNPADEALYPVCETDADGMPLDGRAGPYRLEFPPGGLPPARAFWSLTMYHAEGLLVDNVLGRYAVGDRTPGLEPAADGSLRVEISASPPPSGNANWLPAPDGPFRLMLRLYWPERRDWAPPPVVRSAAA